ncbi:MULTISPECIES: type I restriction endonuclease [Pseudomonas]|jgi:predicted type IV restriction endonuclease|uniref:Type I restriction enzyme HsdR N-terminal domain-containing protein n=1 Tax=Pseudomonas shahriarae TaxID=2745512 RepID=A0ABT5N7Q9_9PSED|nr:MULTISPECIES: type I restriction endonuclease [Pseudomonas]OAE17822.1 restriction endonuclease [Pseudomonas brenneri]MBJ2250898.1 type I restriction enzyme HsdR N-terminal domain-containing protein [Pseudomonas sp. MF6784]MBJ2288482.1 type I restriction enzyme HsdR N-terminal domain-containing protein [Pseudomonas sp. MF5691]MBK3452224.1 type I restriction enzyme HsdR N-terminal domain-containing protein [Pseudomonas sp. MF6754]MBU4626512.1 type I restriction enzyme HsdR N-terminal domain-c
MEFFEKLTSLAAKIRLQGPAIQTEEATKNAFVMPFINTVLGYDVFDPQEVTPEFVCDIGTKKGEKIDYAIMKDGEVQILIECKKIGEPLNLNHASQLFRYFHVTSARISILTNGQVYKFFTDLDAPNKMDEKPFLELDLLDIDEYSVPELTKLTKSAFDVDSIINAAGELKYVSQIKKVIASQLTKPEDDFVKVFASRVYEGVITQKIREQFYELTRKALSQFLNDQINDRLKSAMSGAIQPTITSLPVSASANTVTTERDESEEKVLTTLEELEGYHIVRAVVRSVVDAKRIVQRDTQSYFGILLDDNNRKPICRLHFNRSQKYIGIFDEEKNETRHAISSIDEIYEYSDHLKKTVGYYD